MLEASTVPCVFPDSCFIPPTCIHQVAGLQGACVNVGVCMYMRFFFFLFAVVIRRCPIPGNPSLVVGLANDGWAGRWD